VENRGILFRFPAADRIYFPLPSVQIGCGAHNRFRGSSRWVKRPARKADHSPPSSDEIMNEWTYISTSPVYLRVAHLRLYPAEYIMPCSML
jgi:hypothetical protein